MRRGSVGRDWLGRANGGEFESSTTVKGKTHDSRLEGPCWHGQSRSELCQQPSNCTMKVGAVPPATFPLEPQVRHKIWAHHLPYMHNTVLALDP